MKRFINTNPFKLSVLVLLVAIGFSACKKNEDIVEVTGNAKIRVINTIVGSTAQDVYQNDTKVSTTAIAYGQNTDYLTIKAGTTTSLTLKNIGTTTATATSLATATIDGAYTAFYYSNATGTAVITGFEDDNTAPAAGKVRIRFVNIGTSFLNSINISTTGGTLVTSGLASGYVSTYNTIDANVGLNVVVVGSADVKLIPGTEFQAGKIYTVWFDAATTTMANYHVVAQN